MAATSGPWSNIIATCFLLHWHPIHSFSEGRGGLIMMVKPVWLKPGIWGAVVGGVVTMILGFGWGGWTTSGTASQMAVKQADAAVTSALVPICLAGEKVDMARIK